MAQQPADGDFAVAAVIDMQTEENRAVQLQMIRDNIHVMIYDIHTMYPPTCQNLPVAEMSGGDEGHYQPRVILLDFEKYCRMPEGLTRGEFDVDADYTGHLKCGQRFGSEQQLKDHIEAFHGFDIYHRYKTMGVEVEVPAQNWTWARYQRMSQEDRDQNIGEKYRELVERHLREGIEPGQVVEQHPQWREYAGIITEAWSVRAGRRQ